MGQGGTPALAYSVFRRVFESVFRRLFDANELITGLKVGPRGHSWPPFLFGFGGGASGPSTPWVLPNPKNTWPNRQGFLLWLSERGQPIRKRDPKNRNNFRPFARWHHPLHREFLHRPVETCRVLSRHSNSQSWFRWIPCARQKTLPAFPQRKGASMDLCTFQKSCLKDLDTFRGFRGFRQPFCKK